MNSQLLSEMKSDLKKAMSREVEFRREGTNSGTLYEATMSIKNVVRAIISMYPELGTKPDKATDEQTIQLLKKYVLQEKTRELYVQKILTEADVSGLSAKELNNLIKSKITEMGKELTSMNIGIAQSYLPKEVSVDEIKEWIIENIDFSQYKNKMQAMGPIMKQFNGADGNVVKQILMSL